MVSVGREYLFQYIKLTMKCIFGSCGSGYLLFNLKEIVFGGVEMKLLWGEESFKYRTLFDIILS
jgi:hypothetical protein